MKQFLLFACSQYYPSGGWNDLKGDFETLDEAKEEWNKYAKEKVYDWGHIVDLKTGEMVEDLRLQNY
jgi:hypothetical protein